VADEPELSYDHRGLVLGWAIDSLADFAANLAEAHGGRVDRWDGSVVCDAASSCLFINNAVLTSPLRDGSMTKALDRIEQHFTAAATAGPYLLWSAWPTPDLRDRGYELVGHPPIMLRPAGGSLPPDPPGLEIREATDDATLADAERVGVLGYPLPMVDPEDRGALLPTPLLDSDVRTWVGYVDGEPVTSASVQPTAEVNCVEFVATLEGHRGKGYGEAVTWRATLADPAKPAVLEASDLGRPVYERMGYLGISRMTLWLHPRG
jgi:GNAT superfamily N-acetyltransferase